MDLIFFSKVGTEGKIKEVGCRDGGKDARKRKIILKNIDGYLGA